MVLSTKGGYYGSNLYQQRADTMAVIFTCTVYFLKYSFPLQVHVLAAEHGDHCLPWKFNNYTSSFTREYPEISLSWYPHINTLTKIQI